MFLFVLIADIFGISDHNLMYTQEAVEAPEEISNTVTDEAIEARVRILCISVKAFSLILFCSFTHCR